MAGVLLLCCLPLLSQTQADFSPAAEQIQKLVASGAVPGMAVAVTRHGAIVWEQGFGWADRDRRVRATADTPFYLASVTKSLTSTAVMALQHSGKLDLDAPINRYLGAAKVHSPMWNANEATVRRVATHMSGLTTFYRACNARASRCRVSLDEEIARYGVLVWPPGERFDYSNLGYAILGRAVERISKETFADFLTRSVFAPLGMKHCGLDGAPGAAQNYDQDSHQPRRRQVSGTPGASAAYCSAHDLALFAMFHLKDHLRSQRQILPDSALDELHRPVTHLHGQQYAIGWWTDERDGERIIFGQGGTRDSFTLLELFPAEDAAIVLLADSWSNDLNMPNAIERAIVAKLMPGHVAQADAAPPQPAAAQAMSPKLVGKWTGHVTTYAGTVPVTISISASGEASGHVGNEPDAPLRSVSTRGDHFYGILAGDLHEDDAPPPPYDVEFDLFLRGDKLAGAATTRPNSKSDAQLPNWVELESK